MARRVVANVALSLDGRVSGSGGPSDMGWVVPHALSDAAREHMVAVTSAATTAVLGRSNYEGFGGFWPGVADDDAADPRDRAFSAWLDGVEKVVFSHTLAATPTVPWTVRITDAEPVEEIRALQAAAGGDIVVLASISIIAALLASDAVDRLSLTLCPTISGGGRPLFGEATPASDWRLTLATPTDTGALCLLYDRAR